MAYIGLAAPAAATLHCITDSSFWPLSPCPTTYSRVIITRLLWVYTVCAITLHHYCNHSACCYYRNSVAASAASACCLRPADSSLC